VIRRTASANKFVDAGSGLARTASLGAASQPL
jgi:hypothetical protein